MNSNHYDKALNSLVNTLGELYPNICYYILDKDLKYIYFNQGHWDIMNQVGDVDIQLNTAILDYIHDDKIKSKINNAYQKVLQGESLDEIDEYPIKNSSETITRCKYYRPLKNDEQAINGIIVIASEQKIIQQSSLEAQLLRNDKLMQETNALAKIGGWEFNLKTQESYFTSGTFDIYDIEDGKTPTVEEGINFYNGDSKELISDAFTKAIEEGKPYDLEVDFTSAKGIHKILRTIGRVEEKDGKPIRVYGAIQDLTETNRIIETSQLRQQQFDAIFDGAPLPISMISLDGPILGINAAFKKIIGYSIDEIPDIEKWYQVAYPPDQIVIAREKWKAIYKSVKEGKSEFAPLIRHINCKNGKKAKMELHFALSGDFLIVIFNDITEQTEAEEALVRSELMYKNLFHQSPVMIDSLNSDAEIVRVNDFWLQQLGYSYLEVVGKPIFNFIHPQDVESSKKAFHRFLITHTLDSFKFRFLKKNNEVIVVIVNAIAEFDENDQFSRTISVYTDVTKQVQAEKKLLNANIRIRNLINNIPGMVFRCSILKGRPLEFVSQNSKELINLEMDQIIQENFELDSIISESDREEILREIRIAIHETNTYQVSYRLNSKIATNKWVIEFGTVSAAPDGSKIIEGSIFDITDRVILDEKIASTTMETEDRERSRISKEIHDGLQQTLSLSALLFDNLKQSFSASKEEEELLSKGIKHLNLAIEECRNIAHRLMPPSIMDFGLINSIENLVQNMELSSSLHLNFSSNLKNKDRLRVNAETSIYRIIQEAVTNITKHSKAKNCFIQLIRIDENIQLTIEDDGIGFETELAKENPQSLGIKNMQNRAISMFGHLTIESQKDAGTLIICQIPYEINKA